MRQLIAAADIVIPGGGTHIDSLCDGFGVAGRVRRPEDKDDGAQTSDGETGAIARDRIERQEQTADHERRAQIFQQEEHGDGNEDANGDRQQILQPGYGEEAQTAQRTALLLQVTQRIPVAREVAGKEEDQQKPDHFYGLEEPEIHFGVAFPWSAAEEGEGKGKQNTDAKPDVTESAEFAFEIDDAERGQ